MIFSEFGVIKPCVWGSVQPTKKDLKIIWVYFTLENSSTLWDVYMKNKKQLNRLVGGL